MATPIRDCTGKHSMSDGSIFGGTVIGKVVLKPKSSVLLLTSPLHPLLPPPAPTPTPTHPPTTTAYCHSNTRQVWFGAVVRGQIASFLYHRLAPLPPIGHQATATKLQLGSAPMCRSKESNNSVSHQTAAYCQRTST